MSDDDPKPVPPEVDVMTEILGHYLASLPPAQRAEVIAGLLLQTSRRLDD